jgi:hypothetical protein
MNLKSVEDKIWSSIDNSVWNFVWNSVRFPGRNSVWDSVDKLAWASVNFRLQRPIREERKRG